MGFRVSPRVQLIGQAAGLKAGVEVGSQGLKTFSNAWRGQLELSFRSTYQILPLYHNFPVASHLMQKKISNSNHACKAWNKLVLPTSSMSPFTAFALLTLLQTLLAIMPSLEQSRYISPAGPWFSIPSAWATVSQTSTWLCFGFIQVSAQTSSHFRGLPCPLLYRRPPLSLLSSFLLRLLYCFSYQWSLADILVDISLLLMVCFPSSQLYKIRVFDIFVIISSESRTLPRMQWACWVYMKWMEWERQGLVGGGIYKFSRLYWRILNWDVSIKMKTLRETASILS